MGQSYTDLVGAPPNPATDYVAFLAWIERLAELRLAYCDLPRALTFYFAADGDDGGAGNQASPFRSLTKAQEIHDTFNTDVALLFKRGDEFDVPNGEFCLFTGGLITVGDYGDPDQDIPLFTRFTVRLTSDWSNEAGNRWINNEAREIAAVRLKTDPFNPLTKATSAANCEATPWSWFWDSVGSVLHIETDGLDPNSVIFEAVESNTDVMFRLEGDASIIKNIRVDGNGIDADLNGATQAEGIQIGTQGTDVAVAHGCECYYGQTHLVAHLMAGQTGGISAFIDCAAGFSYIAGTGATNIFNAYSLGGIEALFVRCNARFGALRDNLWYAAATMKLGPCTGFNSHVSGGQTVGLIAIKDCQCPAENGGAWAVFQDFTCASPVAAAAITDVRVFVDKMTQESADHNGYVICPTGVVRSRCHNTIRPANATAQCLTTISPTGWDINSTTVLDLTNQTTSPMGFYNTAVTTNTPKLWHWHFRLTNCGVTFAIDRDNYNVALATGSSDGAELKNCILEASTTGAGVAYVGLNNIAAQQTHNAYRGFTQATGVRGWGNDAGAQTFTTAWTLGQIPPRDSACYQTGLTTLGVSADMYEFRRLQDGLTSIGPVEHRLPRTDRTDRQRRTDYAIGPP